MILKVGLPSLNAFFSGPKSQNDKVSERELHADSKTHLTIIPSAICMGVMTI